MYTTQTYFNNINFLDSVFDLKKLPIDNSHEVAFVGRSNCGKSSIINVITQKSQLAIVSKTPGRTQSINYFKVCEKKYLVDLPGYGFANVPNKIKSAWSPLLENYFLTRKSLKGIICIMDIRHPLKEFDLQMLFFCSHHKIPIHIVLNKSDKLSKSQINAMLTLVNNKLAELHYTSASIQPFSALKKQGVAELQFKVIQWLEDQGLPTPK